MKGGVDKSLERKNNLSFLETGLQTPTI
jgi:hypothetical protein